MKNLRFHKIILLFVMAIFSTMVFAKNIQTASSLKDPGVINEERILYWLTKRGELKADATAEERQAALKKYLKRTENGAYQLPANLAKYDARWQQKLQSLKPEVSLKKVQAKNANNKTVNILAVLIDFPDLPYNDNRLTAADTDMFYDDYSAAHYNGLIFSTSGFPGPSSQNFMSAYQYFQSISGGSLFMQGTVVGWVTADNDAATYGGNDPDNDDRDLDVPSLVKEAITKAVALGGFDLADYDVEDQYDRNGNGNVNEPDGIIDHVMIYHSSMGEEAGGGVLGDDAIWSHRFFVDPGSWGYTIPGTSYAVMGYTIEPLDAATGVVIHEFGHDLGVRDEYNTDSSESADGSPVGHWSAMASGSWAGSPVPGSQPTGFSPWALNSLQTRYGGNWIDITTYTLADLTTTPQTVTLTEAVNNNAATNIIKVEIPEPLITFFPPFSGNYQYYSGEGDLINNVMSFDVTVPSATTAELRMKAHWNIETDWDYARVLVDGVAIEGNETDINNPRQAGITNYITGISANLAGATGAEGWFDLTFDMTAYQGTTVTVTIEYVTDEHVGNYGFVADDIELFADAAAVYFNGAEVAAGTTLNGFSRISSTRQGKDQNYWVQMRSFNGVDAGLATRALQRGMLVWFDDSNFSDNKSSLHPGQGFIGVVDAGQVTVMNGSTPASTTTQVKDATFSLYDAADSSTFDDGDDYTTPEQPASGIILPRHGLNINIETQQVNSASASITFSVGEVAWMADFTSAADFRTVSFANLSNGTGNATASWDFGDGSAPSSEWEPTYTYSSSGDFTVTLTVTTVSDGSTDVAIETISIAELLTTSFLANQDNGVVSFTSSISGGQSSYTYSWDFGDGSASVSEANPTYTYTVSGTYTVTLTVTSSDNQTATFTEVLEVYILPVAGYTVATNNLGASFTDTSSGGDGNYTYAWDFGEGGTSTDASPNYTYSTAGTYTVVLTITDGQNNSNDFSSDVTVTNAPPPPPPPPAAGGGGGSTGWLLLGLLLIAGRLRKLQH